MMADKSMYEPLPLDEADAGPGTDDAPIGLHDDPYLKNASKYRKESLVQAQSDQDRVSSSYDAAGFLF